MLVSIPQAVSTVATIYSLMYGYVYFSSFNTASGKHCCNINRCGIFNNIDIKFQYRKR